MGRSRMGLHPAAISRINSVRTAAAKTTRTADSARMEDASVQRPGYSARMEDASVQRPGYSTRMTDVQMERAAGNARTNGRAGAAGRRTAGWICRHCSGSGTELAWLHPALLLQLTPVWCGVMVRTEDDDGGHKKPG